MTCNIYCFSTQGFGNKIFDTIIVDCVNLLASNALLKLPKDSSQEDSDKAILFQIDDLHL